MVNPLTKGPGAGLPAANLGQRYLIVEDIGSENNTQGSSAWGNVIALANSIIEYDGTDWQVSFDSQYLHEIQYVTNLNTGVQYRWAQGAWMKSYEGWYDEGDYSIVI